MKSAKIYSVCQDDQERQGAKSRRGKLQWGSTEAREDDASQRSREETQRHHRAVSLTEGVKVWETDTVSTAELPKVHEVSQ